MEKPSSENPNIIKRDQNVIEVSFSGKPTKSIESVDKGNPLKSIDNLRGEIMDLVSEGFSERELIHTSERLIEDLKNEDDTTFHDESPLYMAISDLYNVIVKNNNNPDNQIDITPSLDKIRSLASK
jgi:hypothetical protein